jgi:hypothetical protein
MPVRMYPFVRFNVSFTASFLLNSAMLSPTNAMPPFMDLTTVNLGSGDYILDPDTGAAYYYPGRQRSVARLISELYRWVPIGTTYTVMYQAGAAMPPLDPTLW